MELWQFIVSIVVAVVSSDVAAVITTLIYQKHESKKARLMALRSLLNEVERIRGVVAHNSELDAGSQAQPIARVPVIAFETIFVSGRPGLDVGEELLRAVTDYLVCADSINSLVDVYPFSVAGYGTGTIEPKEVARQIAEASRQKLPKILERLETHLQEEINA